MRTYGQQSVLVVIKAMMLGIAFLSIVSGVVSGLLRLGWPMPWLFNPHALAHGPLMVCGFLGVVISLERAVAAGRAWAYFAPFTAALGGVVVMLGLPAWLAAVLFVGASSVISFTTAYIYVRQPTLFTRILLLSCISWLIGNVMWLNGATIQQVMPWWLSFLVLTIAGERLELSRFLPTSKQSQHLFVLISGLILLGAIISSCSDTLNVTLFSIGLLALSVWLMRHDIARHTIKQRGLSRYIAACLLSGYLWLLAGALIGLLNTPLQLSSSYDAFLHAVFVGFVFSMIFGHALIILPAITRLKVSYHPIFYLPLMVLHASLMIRILGDVWQSDSYRSMGGLLNAWALLIFAVCMVSATVRANTSRC